MIIELYGNNFGIFNDDFNLNLRANLKNRNLPYNYYKTNNIGIVKSLALYGPNNTGKTQIIYALNAIKNVILDEDFIIRSNFFNEDINTKLGFKFLYKENIYYYEFIYNAIDSEFIFEKFGKELIDSYGNKKDEVWFIKDDINGVYTFTSDNEQLTNIIESISNKKPLFHQLDVEKFSQLKEIKSILYSEANNIEIVSLDDISLNKTIEILKSNNQKKNQIVKFIKKADLFLDNFEYINTKDKIEKFIPSSILNLIEEKKISENIIDNLKLISTYKGKQIPSIYDSVGTRKFQALASYIIEALNLDKTLVIDEIDTSLHFLLTREIISLFNNIENTKAQLIFTTHDISILDCKKLFRKDQIWFLDKDEENQYLYSLDDFTAENGVRSTSDIISKYRKGDFGAIPDPQLIDVLLDIKDNRTTHEK